MKSGKTLPALVALMIILTGCSGLETDKAEGTTGSAAQQTADSLPAAKIPTEETPSTEPTLSADEQSEQGETTVKVGYVLNVDSNDGFNITDSDSQVHVLFSTSETVTDFKLLSLTLEDSENGDFTFAAQEVYSLKELTPNQPLAAGLEFIGDIPNNGISYVDTDGVTRRYAVDMSGRDSSLFLWEF